MLNHTVETAFEPPGLEAPAVDVLRAVDVPVVVLDAAAGRVVAVSRGTVLLTGLSEAQLVGGPVAPAVARAAEESAVLRAVEAVLGGSPTRLVTTVAAAEGGPRRQSWSVGVPTTSDGRPLVVLTGTTGPGAADADGPWVRTDTAGVVTGCSAAAARLMGYAVHELVGHPVPIDLFDPQQLSHRAAAAEEPPGLRLLLVPAHRFERRRDRQIDLGDLDRRRQDTRQSTADDACDWTFVTRDGERVVVSLSVRPLHDAAGLLVGYEATGVDVTEDRRTHSLLVQALLRERAAAHQLSELDRAREEFVATASHELRTPVASILGYVELLEDALPEVDPVALGFLATIRRSAERLRSMSEDLLVLSRMDTDKHQRDEGEQSAGEADLVEVARHVRETMGPLVTERRVTLSFDVPAEPLTVTGSADGLEQALLNLVSNAVKFTPPGGRVDCRIATVADEAVIEVRDTGIGIAEADLERLFTRFFRARSAREQKIPGVGLGLSIVDAIVASHGGRVDVSSTLGQGTTFVLHLPR